MHPFWNTIFGAKAPTVSFCESATALIIARPISFLSNLPYIGIGLYLISRKNQAGYLIGGASVLVGVASMIYDASYTFGAQTIDLMAMMILIHVFFYSALRPYVRFAYRLIGLLLSNQLIYAALVIMLEGRIGQIYFALMVLGYVLLEVILAQREPKRHTRYFWYAVTTFVFGVLLWLPDGLGLWCPEWSVFSGRVLYHIITAFAVLFVYQHIQANAHKQMKSPE